MRPPRSGPLQTLSDGEVLRLIARNLQSRARLLRERITPELLRHATMATEQELLIDGAARLREIARRVPLWTRRPR